MAAHWARIFFCLISLFLFKFFLAKKRSNWTVLWGYDYRIMYQAGVFLAQVFLFSVTKIKSDVNTRRI
jgi:hypothetical protein